MVRLALALAACAAICGCTKLPDKVERAPSSAPTDTAGTHLGRALAAAVAAHRNRSGIYPLVDGRDAFAARELLTIAAERSLDVQYYIWHADTTGSLLAEALWEAAERGVRVRVLLDDNNTRGLDDAIAALDAHPNIEVRLFNPYANRGFRLAELLSDFSRVNRRMHNKSFTVDNQATIVGGRNVGDEYFGAESAVEFQDVDALAVGSVVSAVSASFDAYWNSEAAYPAASLIRGTPASTARVRDAWAKLHGTPRAARYLEALRASPMLRELFAGKLPFEWVPAHVVSDDPSKILHPPQRESAMLSQIDEVLGKPARALDLVSAYFVPTEAGTAALGALAGRGVKVRVLTNSLAATDVSPVHAGYEKYREALLRAGVKIHELKPGAGPKGDAGERPPGIGSSAASLHAKTFAVDGKRIFIGSFNLDPRSARLNTEMGLVVESAALAKRLSAALDARLPRVAYEVRLAKGDSLEWLERTDQGELRHRSEPGVGWARRLWVGFLSLLPIEWLL